MQAKIYIRTFTMTICRVTIKFYDQCCLSGLRQSCLHFGVRIKLFPQNQSDKCFYNFAVQFFEFTIGAVNFIYFFLQFHHHFLFVQSVSDYYQ